MSTALVIVPSYDPTYLRISEHLINIERSQDRRVKVLDITRSSASAVDTYHRGTLRLFGLSYPGHDLEARLAGPQVEVMSIKDVLATAPEVQLDERQSEELEIAVRSALITFFRTEVPNTRRRDVARLRRRLRKEGLDVYRAVRGVLSSDNTIDEVVVPNGRFPNQRMAAVAASELSIATMHFEKGETPNGAYFQPYAPQDRLKSQAAVESTLDGVSPSRIDEIADEWLAKRNPSSSSRNEFSALWDATLPDSTAAFAGHQVAGFFTSSQDEYLSLGPEWQRHSWEDQFEAFHLTMTALEQAGVHCYLRVHPNLATKAHASYRQEVERIRRLANLHPDLSVIWHDDFTNTYALLDQSNLLVTWDSTIGLEASARGIPVWNLATSRYSLTADVREVLSADDISSMDPAGWQVDAHAAKRYIAYLVLRDTQIPDTVRSWESWDASGVPLGARLARIPVSGGNPTVATAVRSLVDVYRHRRFRSNIRARAKRWISPRR